MEQGFQHSQPQSVYRQKNRAILGLMIPLSLAMFGFSVYRFVTRTNTNEDLFLASIWLISLINSSHTFFRIRLTMSPSGISVTVGRSRATAWSNVEGIQMIVLGDFIKRQVLCLVLREPIQSKRWQGVLGVPDELKGRILQIHPAVWERMFTLQDELYGYLKANSVIGNELAVPLDFASISQRQTKFVWGIKVAMVGLILLVMVIGAVVLVKII